MRSALTAMIATLILCTTLTADEKIDATKLIGKWEPKEKPGRGMYMVEYKPHGLVTFATVVDGKETKIDGTYTIDGDKLTLSLGVPVPHTIVKLTDADLVTKDAKGKERSYTRIKDK